MVPIDAKLTANADQFKSYPVKQKKLKNVPVEYHGVDDSAFNGDTLWFRIYKMPKIEVMQSLVIFKRWLTIGAAIKFGYDLIYLSLGTSYLQANMMTPFYSFFSVASMLYITEYFRKIILQVYVSEDEKYARLSRLGFWGKRLDMIVPYTSIIPLTLNNKSALDLILEIKLIRPEDIDMEHDFLEYYDQDFKLTLFFGGVTDPGKFENLFGTILRTSG